MEPLRQAQLQPLPKRQFSEPPATAEGGARPSQLSLKQGWCSDGRPAAPHRRDGTAKISDVGMAKIMAREYSGITGNVGTLAWVRVTARSSLGSAGWL
jgi:hypothetical protein